MCVRARLQGPDVDLAVVVGGQEVSITWPQGSAGRLVYARPTIYGVSIQSLDVRADRCSLDGRLDFGSTVVVSVLSVCMVCVVVSVYGVLWSVCACVCMVCVVVSVRVRVYVWCVLW